MDPSGCFPNGAALLYLSSCTLVSRMQEVPRAAACLPQCVVSWNARGSWKRKEELPPHQALHVCIELLLNLESCNHEGRLITWRLCLSVGCCSVNLGKEEVPWDVAASPRGGGTALDRPSCSSQPSANSIPKVQRCYFPLVNSRGRACHFCVPVPGRWAAERGKNLGHHPGLQ